MLLVVAAPTLLPTAATPEAWVGPVVRHDGAGGNCVGGWMDRLGGWLLLGLRQSLIEVRPIPFSGPAGARGTTGGGARI